MDYWQKFKTKFLSNGLYLRPSIIGELTVQKTIENDF